MKRRIPPLIARRVWCAGLPGLRTVALTLALVIGLIAPAVRATVTVSNVTAAQTPGTKEVVITYDVASTASSSVTISLAIRDGETPIPATSLSGDIGAGVATGTDRSITWNAGADWNGNFSDNLTGVGTDANLEPLAWYYYNSSIAKHREVGNKQANAWGLYDMHGNVWEWCLDWYGTYPGTVTDPVGAGNGSKRVHRGGSWLSSARHCRSAIRHDYGPVSRRSYIGLRVCSASPVQ